MRSAHPNLLVWRHARDRVPSSRARVESAAFVTERRTFLRELNEPEKIEKKMLFDLHILCFVCVFVWHIYARGKRKESIMGFLLGRSFSAMLRFLAPLLVGLFSQSVTVTTTGKICAFLKVTVQDLKATESTSLKRLLFRKSSWNLCMGWDLKNGILLCLCHMESIYAQDI